MTVLRMLLIRWRHYGRVFRWLELKSLDYSLDSVALPHQVPFVRGVGMAESLDCFLPFGKLH